MYDELSCNRNFGVMKFRISDNQTNSDVYQDSDITSGKGWIFIVEG